MFVTYARCAACECEEKCSPPELPHISGSRCWYEIDGQIVCSHVCLLAWAKKLHAAEERRIARCAAAAIPVRSLDS
jgi:hypothetical protein